MKQWFVQLSPIMQALCGTGFTWLMTALGAALVFFFNSIERKVLDSMLGFAAGVMIAASFWSLLEPAIEMAESNGIIPWLPPLVGFLGGGLCLWGVDRFVPHLHPGLQGKDAEGIKTSWRRSVLRVIAVALHNIPEGLAIGVAFGAVATGHPAASLGAAIALAIGIGIQNFPEGAAASIPLRGEGLSKTRSFMYGQCAGLVEPIAGILGAAAVVVMQPLLPYALSFAAGAMIYVVAEELIPESRTDNRLDIPTICVIAGFAIMMTLDVALG